MGDTKHSKNTASGIAARFVFHKAVNVKCVNETSIEVTFQEGVVKRYDLTELAEEYPVFKTLLNDPPLFRQARAQGYGIIWSDEIDLSTEEIWHNGETVRSAFDGLLSMKEATDRWGINESTIRKAIAAGRFEEGIDIKKFGKQWVLSRGSVEREYGPALADIDPELEYPEHVKRRINI
ncbi:MAG: DUF2442 domain-containing protein [Firmicutes bacterium]|nr:DUF2442 domain-containing protein [Bacillota bacterium]